MKPMQIICAAIFCLTVAILAAPAAAQNAHQTGDRELDSLLQDVDRVARDSAETFTRRACRELGMTSEQMEVLTTAMGLAPSDAYMAAKVAKISGKPLDEVVKAHTASQGKGWGVIAKSMGIKPGSAEFHELKSGAAAVAGEDAPPGKSRGKGHGKKKGHKKNKN